MSKTEAENSNEKAFFPSATVVIVGLGLIGGSLALGLRGHCARLYGVDQNPQVVRQALELQIVDCADTDLAVLLPEADLVLIAIPVRSSLKLITQLPKLHSGSSVVIDMGSTKCAVIDAMQALPERFDPLGGHPMCGKENGTLANAEAALFQHAPFAFVPLTRTTERAKAIAQELSSLIGARPLWLQADQHDRWVAYTSHLPHLLATALALGTPFECAPLIGPGFRSTSRLAAGSPEMKLDILLTNRDAILEALEQYHHHLSALSESLRQNDIPELQNLLLEGAERRQVLIEANDAIV